ncbi:DNA methyltransferase [Micromonas commoda]|uniref:tRNA (cytosine(38)-C(5))-methyltransferase n=1 Tax=Micromonas commoda (strain RCC299 / NOUM17 / CCMP2709) TaxID=296587 RepID=C1DYI1_MICCC|nr:DNA methyltransferase [Micromonas commoda]ACO60948.1 DNA methyltransferase [Micromonas commoda]|eukprot:XP_002499690.1 DNA methyltransferase [Micromonas commoda]
MSAAAPAAAVSPTPRHRRHHRRRTSWRGRLAASSSAPASTSGSDGPSSSRETTATARSVKMVEFYAGMGTMRWSLERALESDMGASVTALASIDNSEVANAVYLANYPDENASGVLMRRNVEHLSSVETLDARFGGADVWTLSPPCQPYTRKGKRLHGEDPRAGSFARILEALPKLRAPPERILVENVVGFESSETRRALVAALDEAGYVWREYHASPVDIGVPCTRTRYYALAKRKPLSFVDCAEDAGLCATSRPRPRRIAEYLERPVHDADLAVEAGTVERYWRWLDVVSPSCVRCSTFTSGYGKTVYGGSVLASDAFVAEHCDVDAGTGRARLVGPFKGEWAGEMRYFSPREMANLHGLDAGWRLPSRELTRRQLWFTVGNSISVDVVAALMRQLMRD